MAGLAKFSWLLVAVGLLVMTGCAPGTGVGGGPTAVDGPAKSVTTPQREDKAFAKVVQAAGFDSGTAAFAVLTTSTLQVVNGHTYIVRQDFANGATATTAIHLFTGGDGTPEQRPKVKLTSMGSTAMKYTFSYAIATKDLPADLRAQVLAGLPGGAPAQAERDGAVAAFGAPAGGLRVPAQSEPSTIDIVVDGVVNQTVSTGIKKSIETAGLDKTHVGTSWKVFKAGKKVWAAIEANQMISDALARIKAARKCAENPTNELTRKQYEEDPGAKEELLRQLDEIASEVTTSGVSAFVGLFTETAGGLVKTAPWLGFITGPAGKYVKETVAYVIEERVKAAEQMVTKCTKYRITGDSQVSVQPTVIEGLGQSFTVKASKDGVPLTYTFSGRDRPGKAGTVRLSGGTAKWSVSGEGHYIITGSEPGPYDLRFSMQACVDIGTCNNVSHIWKITPFSET